MEAVAPGGGHLLSIMASTAKALAEGVFTIFHHLQLRTPLLI